MRSLILFMISFNFCLSSEFNEESLKVEVSKMVSILKNKTINSAGEFLDAYYNPPELEKLKKRKSIYDVYVSDMAGGSADAMIEAFDQTKEMRGNLNAEKSTISYSTTLKSGVKIITFIFIDGKWYYANDRK